MTYLPFQSNGNQAEPRTWKKSSCNCHRFQMSTKVLQMVEEVAVILPSTFFSNHSPCVNMNFSV